MSRRKLLSVVTAAVLMAMATMAALRYSSWGAQVPVWAKSVLGTGGPKVAHMVLHVEGMDCIMCAGGLQATLRQIPGVRHAEVSFQEKTATLTYDPHTVNPLRFVRAINDAGFKVLDAPQTLR